MIELLIKCHLYFYSLNDINNYKYKNKIKWFFTNIAARFFRYIINKWVLCKSIIGIYSKPSSNINNDIVISLTSFPARIGKVWMTIDSLMRQTICPYCINLYLSKQDFPDGEKSLKMELLRYQKIGLNIIWVDENLRPHKKYLYSFQSYPNKCVITTDDDLYYRKDMVERLWNLHSIYPNAVCANNAKLIPTMKDGKLPLYSTWYKIQKPAIGLNIIGIGSGGILYPVTLFQNTPYNNVSLIKELALGTDDLWLKMMELIANIPVVTGNYNCGNPGIIGSQKSSLSKENWKIEDKNDVNWRLLVDHFNLSV